MGTGGAGKVGAGIGFNNLPIQQTKVFKKNLAAKRNKKNSQSIPAIKSDQYGKPSLVSKHGFLSALFLSCPLAKVLYCL